MLRTILFFIAASFAFGQFPTTPSGEWLSQRKYFDNNIYQRMRIQVSGSDTNLSGKLGNQELSGTFRDGHFEASVKLSPNATLHLSGDLKGDRIEGVATATDSDTKYQWVATRIPARTTPKTYTFDPTSFEHFFSDAAQPVLHLGPGDIVKTWSVDAGGFDSKNASRTSGGNPLTGPFYVDGAAPGDTLVVRFNQIRLNRDTARSSPLIVNTALTADYVERRKNVPGYDATWKLDRDAGFASLLHPPERLKDYKIPLAPMLGCVGVAPAGGNRFRSAYLGNFGGNMDYNQLREGTTVYLPVFVPGALLFVGDGHAAQGAGELTGNALETSMDIEFTVDVIAGMSPRGPRMENSQYLMASGMSESLDDAFRDATTNLVQWLEKTYGLNAAEVSSVVSTAVTYDIAEYVDPEDHVVAKISKSVLSGLHAIQ